jgi:uncharacterized membrane protein YsdA (DUF1294 family)
MSIISRFTLFILGLILACGLGLAWFFPHTLLADWLAAVNVVTLLAYGYDKTIAGSGKMRAPEAVLLGLALIGGSPAALLAMQILRHKTSKPGFQLRFWLILILQCLLLAAGLILFRQ